MAKLAKYKEEILSEFEQKSDEWNFADFEERLKKYKKNASYHDAKSIISEAHNSGLYPKTVKRYILTNYCLYGNVSTELSDVLQDVYKNLTPQEKEYWGIQ